MIKLNRMHIRQPYPDRPLHEFHGMNVLVEPGQTGASKDVYFTEGDVISGRLPISVLYNGWPSEKPPIFDCQCKRCKPNG